MNGRMVPDHARVALACEVLRKELDLRAQFTDDEMLQALRNGTEKDLSPARAHGELLTTEETAGLLKCSRRQVFRLIRQHRLPVIHLGKRSTRIRASALAAL